MSYVLQDYEKLFSSFEFALSVQKVLTLAVALKFSEFVSMKNEDSGIWGRIKQIQDPSKVYVDNFLSRRLALKNAKKLAFAINASDYDEKKVEIEFNQKEKEEIELKKIRDDYDSDIAYLNDEDSRSRLEELGIRLEMEDEREIAELEIVADIEVGTYSSLEKGGDPSVLPLIDSTFALRQALGARKLLKLSIDKIIDDFIESCVKVVAEENGIIESKEIAYNSMIKLVKNKIVEDEIDEEVDQKEKMILYSTEKVKERRALFEKINYLT